MPEPELTEEDVMMNDKDPMEALREIRRDEGVPEDDLPERISDVADTDVLDQEDTDVDELAALEVDNDTATEQSAADEDTAAEKAVDDAVTAADVAADASAADPDNKELADAATEAATVADAAKEGKVDKGEAEEPATSTIRKFRANGQDFEFTAEEINDQFETVFGQAMDYTKKMQKIAPYRKMISALEQEGVSQDRLNLALDALKGDKGALKKLMEDNKIDAYDLTSEGEEKEVYNPTSYGKDEQSLDIEEITRTIQNDKEFQITTNVIDEQWDSDSRQLIVKNPGMITGLHNDIKTGLYDKVAPAAMKMKVLDGNTKSDIEYYMIAGEQLRLSMEAEAKTKDGQDKVDELNKDAQGADDKFDKASSEAQRKRAANSTNGRADKKGVMDYLDDDDEAYDEWYKKTMST